MSGQPLAHDHHKSQHGATQSYIVGFLLSLILTFIPYYLVVHQSLSGTSLLGTIIDFAVLQMIVQIFFFLHLGRGPKPLYNVIFFVATVGIVLVVILGSVFIMNNLHYNMTPPDVTTKLAQDEAIAQVDGVQTGACQEVYTNHQVTIRSNTVTPLQTEARLCDSLVFNNDDATMHIIVLGSASYSEVYGGQKEIVVHKGFPATITLNQLGTYQFHDQLGPAITGQFTVTPR